MQSMAEMSMSSPMFFGASNIVVGLLSTVGVRNLRRPFPSKPIRALLPSEVIRIENSANNGEAFE